MSKESKYKRLKRISFPEVTASGSPMLRGRFEDLSVDLINYYLHLAVGKTRPLSRSLDGEFFTTGSRSPASYGIELTEDEKLVAIRYGATAYRVPSYISSDQILFELVKEYHMTLEPIQQQEDQPVWRASVLVELQDGASEWVTYEGDFYTIVYRVIIKAVLGTDQPCIH